jgi:tetratricopeptide (TPR) repeat protein
MISTRHQIIRANSWFRAGRRAGLTVIVFACMELLPGRVLAGGGPENVLLVVNGDSPVSLQVANTYVAMRGIPQEHVLWLHDIPYPDSISIETFRTRIWQPIRDFITQNRLDDGIDIIAYSADFPYAVNFSADLKANKLPKLKYHGKEASLTGLTYFARHVESGSPYYLAGNANRYFRRNLNPDRDLPRSLTDAEDSLQREADKALRKKDFQGALASYEALVRGFPEHGGLWYGLARSHAALGNPGAAMAALRQAVNHGWSNSLQTRTDCYLQALSDDPAFQPLLQRMEEHNGPFQAAHGFSANYEWTGATQPIKTFRSESLNSFYLATMLAYTGPNGNSVPEVKDYLTAARASDGTQPDGTVYLLVNDDVRSETRQALFLETVAALERRGHRAEILTGGQDQQDGILPRGKGDVIGAVVGAAKFNWQSTGSQLLPGAIAESLTSYGGHFNSDKQTKLTEFLRYGAAGASGAVAEPFSLQAKFPLPLLHVHYADGCSLAEAFYQGVEAPYQLLVVGDPLARPYARFAEVALAAPDPDTPWSGVVTLQPKVVPAPDRPIAQLELWVDGQLIAYALPDRMFTWDTRSQDDGFHDLRLVAQEAGPIETRSYARTGVTLANSAQHLALDPAQQRVLHGETITVSGSAIGGREATLWQGNRKLASAPVKAGRWRLQVASQILGVGPVSLGVRVAFDDNTVVRSAPLKINIAPPAFAGEAPGSRRPDHGKTGAAGTGGNDKEARLVKLNGQLRNLTAVQHLTLAGELMVARSGFFELVVSGAGEISLAVDARPLLSTQTMDRNQARFFPLALEQGPHELQIEFSPADNTPYLKLILEGDQVAALPEVRVVRDVSERP